METHTLIVTEKPDAAKRIAQALDENGKPKKVEERGVPYFISHRGKKIIVVPALGHLYTIMHERGGRNYYPVFNFRWVPRNLAEKGAGQIRQWIDVISKLSKDADEFIDGCDFDIEGSLIGYCILKYACADKERTAKRMKFSTLTKDELEKAYSDLLPKLDFALVEAGRTRHEVDWLYGVNLSRALTLAAERWSGKYTTLSTGRVQGPTLRFLASREKAIHSFVPTPYWTIRAEVEVRNSIYEADYERKEIERKAEADAVVEACRDKTGKIEKIDVRKSRQSPPLPFDLGALQTEAYGLFGYTPRRTANIAERLYLEALISYPRTSSQKLPRTIGYRTILNGLGKKSVYRPMVSDLLKKEALEPCEGRKEDSAHPAIYPTGSVPERTLSKDEERIWDLIVRRFMAAFGDVAVKQSVKATIEVNGHRFYLGGRHVLKEGWMRFYKPYIRTEEVLLPPLEEGEAIKFKKVMREDKFTRPPPRYNPSSLLKKMEEVRIGTKATRADIIETLYGRKYVTGERIAVTDLGFDVIEILNEYCPRAISLNFTRELEEKMDQIQNGSNKRKNVTVEFVERLKPMLTELKNQEERVGRALSEAIKKAEAQERIVANCPRCGSGNLIILYSRKTRKRFIGCTNYFKNSCKASFPLPQRGTLKPLGRSCNACGWPLIEVRTRERRPWRLCFNPDCPLKKGRD